MCPLKKLIKTRYVTCTFIIMIRQRIKTLVFTGTTKNDKIKSKISCFQQSTKKGLLISTGQRGL